MTSEENPKVRVILYTGKGGVGKTTVAAATALRCAQLGHRTILLSADPAHSLADSLEVPLGSEPKLVYPNFWAQEVDVYYSMEKHWGILQRYLRALLTWRGLDEMVAAEMSAFPGMEEVASLFWVEQYIRSGNYDVIIIDCAPTGETLRLLSFPEMARWWMEKFFPLQRWSAQLLGPIVRPFWDMPLPDQEIFDAVEELFHKLDRIHRLLTHGEVATVRLVLNLEKIVIKETQRSYTYLSLYGYATDAVICNRLIPSEVEDAYFDLWKEIQGRYQGLVEECFSPLPILYAPLLDREVVGMAMLELMGQHLFGGSDPASILFRGQTYAIKRENDYYLLTILLPFVEKGDISLLYSGEDLVVQVGNCRRNIVLPLALAGLSAEGARFEGGVLKIKFSEGRKAARSSA